MRPAKLLRLRFQGGPKLLWDFTERQLVVCPACQNRAEVRCDPTTQQATLSCTSCYHVPNQRPAYSLSVNQYCPGCAHRVTVRIPLIKHKTAFVRLKCPHCNTTGKFAPRYEQIRASRSYDGPTDSYFGYPLWLQASFGHEVFWAYNHEHLTHLQDYIGAELRGRQSLTFSTMVERLPSFIKSAKNRHSLLALINKLALKTSPAN